MTTGSPNFSQAALRPCGEDPARWAVRLAMSAALALGAILQAGHPGSLAAQSDSVTVVAGARYEAGSLKRRLLGNDYRDLWTAQIRVPLLDLKGTAGGLTPTQTGGGRQTRSLRFIGADGREYAFRSVHKRPYLATEADVRGALLAHLVQDQVSSMVPSAPLAAAHLSAAVGLLHSQATLLVMPDDPALGEFREEFAGMLGTFEERPDEAEDGGPGFAGFTRIAGTDSMLDNVEDSSEHRIDSRQYLFARLLDLVIGDWDRHEDQWRWARRDTVGGFVWTPIPRDRDYAFADYDGLLMRLVRKAVPNAVRFSDDFRDLDGLLLNGHTLDRQILADLERPVWDSVTALLHSRLTDTGIESAVRRLPPEYVALEGEALIERLRSRRDLLPEVSEAFYHLIAEVPTIYTTDEDETATLIRHPNGSVEVRVEPTSSSSGRALSPYFRRTFNVRDTREIRLFLRGGDDVAIIRGSSSDGLLVRVIGGGGDDVLADSSTVSRRGHWTSLHDSGDDDTLYGVQSTTIDRRPYERPEVEIEGLIRIPDPDSGSRLGVRPLIDYSTTRGVVFGGGVDLTRYAFRRDPFASKIGVNVRYATRWSDFAIHGNGEFQTVDPAVRVTTRLIASRIDALRFYGFGNETTADLPSSLYVVRRELLSAEADLHYALGSRTSVSGGVIGRRSRPWLVEGSPLSMASSLESQSFSSLGVRGVFGFGTPAPEPSRTAYRVGFDLSAFPVTSRADDPFGVLSTHAAARVPLTSAGSTHLSARAGGRYVWGDYPFDEAAFLGGRQSVRGLPQWRYAGDAMLFSGVEATVPIGRLPLGLNWRLAGFTFADAGRVFLGGEDSNRWHAAPGVGFALSALDYHVRVSYAHGPTGRLYLETANPF